MICAFLLIRESTIMNEKKEIPHETHLTHTSVPTFARSMRTKGVDAYAKGFVGWEVREILAQRECRASAA